MPMRFTYLRWSKLLPATLTMVMTGQLMAQSAPQDSLLVVKIAHIEPLSNKFMGDLGVEGNNAAAMAVEDLNARQIKIQGKTAIFKVENLDDAARPDVAIDIAGQVCKNGFAGVVGHLNSGTSIKAAPIYNQCGLPHITVAATNPRLTELGYETTFRVIGNDAVLGKVMGEMAVSKMKVKRVAIVHDRTFYGETIATNFSNAATSLGAELVLNDSISEANPSPTSVIERLKNSNAELVFFGGMDGLAGKLLKEMAYQKVVDVKFMGGDGICGDALARLAGGSEAVSQVICGEAGAPIDKLPGGPVFGARYQSRYMKPVKGYAAQTYDAFYALALAMQTADSVDTKVYLPFLRKINFDGVSGNIAFDPKGDLAHPIFSTFVYRDGKKEVNQ